jgi:hypothetical protein
LYPSQLPTLELFNRILPAIKVQRENSAYHQLAMFIRYCVKQYVKHAQANPLLLVESLFKGVRQSALESKDKAVSDDDEPVTRLRDHQDSDESSNEDDQITVRMEDTYVIRCRKTKLMYNRL